jgi:phosphatidylglycerophosphatase GEP4
MDKVNLSAAFNAFRLLYEPQLARPHAVISQFSDLTFPLGKCIATNVKRRFQKDIRVPDIRAVVVDKDNCIAKPHQLELWPAYKVVVCILYLNCRIPGNGCLTSMARTEY